MPDLSIDLAPAHKSGLRLQNPVLVASGTFGYGTEYQKLIDIQRLGAICSKGITPRPRTGNATPRIVETPAGMLNAIGLQNPGVKRVIRDMAPIWAGSKVTSAVRAPRRAEPAAASTPAWPPPTTITSKSRIIAAPLARQQARFT